MGEIRDGINRILELAVTEVLDIGGRKYTSKSVSPVKEPEPAALVVHTLTGFVDYLASNPDNLNLDDLTIHIKDYQEVQLIGSIFGAFEQRNVYLMAKLITDEFPWGRHLEHEDFVIKMQSMFIKDATVEKILSIVGNIKDEVVATVGDDGTTQQVTAKTGIARVEHINLPNPVTLTPYRTFLEAEQPASRFVFRMRSGAREGNLPTCSLFEADGGRWKLDAIQAIKTWLSNNIKDPVRILA